MVRRSFWPSFVSTFLSMGWAAPAQALTLPESWSKPTAPFRIIGNVYYVGTEGLASYLVATPQGHVLIDGGLPEGAPLIEQSIRALGVKVEDVKILLTTQAHFDHVGSLAALQKASGGRCLWVQLAAAH